ncbi:MAG: hypothetical protein IKJ26_04265 [Clostridia bacterium]|nr:hypothetical protein [Clostridia bacterium]
MKETARSQKLHQYISWGVLILSPFLLLMILSACLGQNTLEARPVWLDELCYWRSLYSWDAMGFDTGFNGMFEETAAIGTLGNSGLGHILIYGWFVKLFGLSHNTIMLGNAVWISLAAAVFCLVRRPKRFVALGLSALIMGYAPIILYSVTSMTELFNYALMLLYLTFLLLYQEKRSPWALLLCCLTVVFGCIYRPMYAVLFIPVVMFFSRYRFGWRMVLSALAAAALSALCWYLGQLAAAPNAQGFPYHLIRAESFDMAWHMLLSHTKANLLDYFHATVSPMQNAFRWMYMALTVLCLLASFLALERRGLKPVRVNVGFRPPFFSCFLLLVAAFALTMMLYEAYDWRDYRMLAPYLWLVIAFFIARHRFTLPVCSYAACLVVLCLLISSPEGAFDDSERFSEPTVPESLPEIVETIAYDPDAEDPFINTIRTDIYSYALMEDIDPGMGLQHGWFSTDTTGKSGWILTDQLKCPVTGYENVLDTGDFKLYRQISKED